MSIYWLHPFPIVANFHWGVSNPLRQRSIAANLKNKNKATSVKIKAHRTRHNQCQTSQKASLTVFSMSFRLLYRCPGSKGLTSTTPYRRYLAHVKLGVGGSRKLALMIYLEGRREPHIANWSNNQLASHPSLGWWIVANYAREEDIKEIDGPELTFLKSFG